MNDSSNKLIVSSKEVGWSYSIDPFKKKKIIYLAGDTVLDVGCYTGAYVNFCNSIGKKAVGIDVISDFIKKADKISKSKADFLVASIDKLPFKNDTFETVLLFDVLEHTSNDKKALSEALRVCTKNVLISVPKKDKGFSDVEGGVTYRHYIDKSHKRYYTKESLLQLVSQLGNHEVMIESFQRIKPILTYRHLYTHSRISYGLLRALDKFLYTIGTSKRFFMRNLFANIMKSEEEVK